MCRVSADLLTLKMGFDYFNFSKLGLVALIHFDFAYLCSPFYQSEIHLNNFEQTGFLMMLKQLA